jgi:hypothetical protein
MLPSSHINCISWLHSLSVYGSAVLSLDLGPFFSFLVLYAVSKTPWMGDQRVTRPLPTHRSGSGSAVLLLDLGHFFSFLVLYTLSTTPWMGDQPITRHTHRMNAHRHPCLEWDLNPRSQCSSERRQFMP